MLSFSISWHISGFLFVFSAIWIASSVGFICFRFIVLPSAFDIIVWLTVIMSFLFGFLRCFFIILGRLSPFLIIGSFIGVISSFILFLFG